MATERLLSVPGVVGAVLAGGASRRFVGGDKAAIIGPRVVDALRNGGVDPIVAIGGTPGALDIPTIADRYPGEGPLGGLATATTFARTGRVLAATCDLPLLDPATIAALLAEATAVGDEVGVVASIEGEPQVSLGVWPAAWARPLHQAMRAGERRFRHVLTLGPVQSVDVVPEALSDADDPATLHRLLAEHDAMPEAEPPGA